MSNDRSGDGITVVEFVVASGVFAILAMIFAEVLVGGINVYGYTTGMGKMAGEAEYAMLGNLPDIDGMVSTVQTADSVLAVTPTVLQLNVSDSVIHFYADADKNLIRENKTYPKMEIVARNIHTIGFKYYGRPRTELFEATVVPDSVALVAVDLEIKMPRKDKIYKVSATIFPRNKS